MELYIAWGLRLSTYGFLIVIMIMMSGCGNTSDPRSQAIDLSVKGLYTPGPSEASTRNQIPQGGLDEKSDSTPTKSPG
jgi:hypothetical protein